MDEKMKELIAIGASIGTHCQPCLTYHLAKAKEIGIAEDDIREAIAVGHMIEKGAMSAMRQFADNLVGKSVVAPGAGGCCGSAAPRRGGRCCG